MGGAVILMAVLTGIYGCVWNGYFNKLIEFPFWRRGNWLMIALYAGILFFFLYTYGGSSGHIYFSGCTGCCFRRVECFWYAAIVRHFI